MSEKTFNLFDNWLIGIILGSITPIIGVYLFYLSQHFSYDFGQFITVVASYSFLGQVLSIGVLANLAVFFLFIQTKCYKSAKGVVLVTLIYAFLTLFIKYLI